MKEFWEASFSEKQEMWGMEPEDSARTALETFKRHGLKKILVPGCGYGRNAGLFVENGLSVTGIEISETAIGLCEKHFGDSIRMHHGSVGQMPFDRELYDGIYCYALIHLLDGLEREKFIQACFDQLAPNGYMVFIAISKADFRYGQGKELSRDTFEMPYGVRLFFYDEQTIASEFGNCGLLGAEEIMESTSKSQGDFTLKFWQISCRKDTVLGA